MFFIKKFYAQYFLRELYEFCFFPAKYIFSDVETVLLFERIMILISTGYYTLTLIKLQKSKFMPTFVSKNFRKNQSEITQNTFLYPQPYGNTKI